MPIKTGRIRYNLKDRGYKAHGTPRNFNIPVIVNAINSEACQERVKSRSMLGFYGHWPRIKFGMMPMEGGIHGKLAVPVEPAIVTTYLHASADGTVEHEAEFLDETESGKVAARLFKSRAGGFSSVIDEVRGNFIGLDYVLEPNFRENRGYTLDSASSMTMDAVDAAIRDEQLHAMAVVLDSVNCERELKDATIKRLEEEREQLYSILAARGPEAVATFDSAMAGGQKSRIVTLDTSRAQAMFAQAERFGSAPLQRTAKAIKADAQQSIIERTVSMARGVFG